MGFVSFDLANGRRFECFGQSIITVIIFEQQSQHHIVFDYNCPFVSVFFLLDDFVLHHKLPQNRMVCGDICNCD